MDQSAMRQLAAGGEKKKQKQKQKPKRRKKRKNRRRDDWQFGRSVAILQVQILGSLKMGIKTKSETQTKPANSVILASFICLLSLSKLAELEALHITNFRLPAYVPINLPTTSSPLELGKPILFDCDYEYEPEEDTRLTVRWFRNKEAEPFYQWLPEFDSQHFADWIKPLVNQSFVSDPHDPLKRYRSLLIRRLSMNLTGQYTCLVSSLAGQDMRAGSLIVYQPPKVFTFERRVFPAPAPPLLGSPASQQPQQQQPTGSSVITTNWLPIRQIGAPNLMNTNNRSHSNSADPIHRSTGPSPTQFKSFGQQSNAIIRPPNNHNNQSLIGGSSNSSTTKIVYTHDGRPIRRQSRRQLAVASQMSQPSWMLRQKSVAGGGSISGGHQRELESYLKPPNSIQLHHFQCHASQVTPRPIIVLTVKRDSDSIAQYLHESSSVSIRPFQVSHSEYYEQQTGRRPLAGNATELLVTLYNITVSATVALNVTLPLLAAAQPPTFGQAQPPMDLANEQRFQQQQQQQQAAPPINTVLPFRRNQRMSFECHLEITGTEFEQRKRININEEEVFQFAEIEEQRRLLDLNQELSAGNDRFGGGEFGRNSHAADSSSPIFGSSLKFASSSSSCSSYLRIIPSSLAGGHLFYLAATLSVLLHWPGH